MAPKAKSPPACTLKELPQSQLVRAATTAIDINPANRPRIERVLAITALCALYPLNDEGYHHSPGHRRSNREETHTEELDPNTLHPDFLAVLTTKYWGVEGVRLTVGFVDNTRRDLADRIISHANAWRTQANSNVEFTYTQQVRDADVRISRGSGGYWSYLGTDVKHIPRDQATMNLERFTLNTDEAEYKRVVRHEFGHTNGYPHEHMRRALINRLDRQKTIDYFQRSQGWSPQMTVQQVLTPLEESSIMGTPNADDTSIMCYQLPASITIDGQPIRGGNDINANDAAFAAKIYPLTVQPPPPPPGPPGTANVTILVALDSNGKEVARYTLAATVNTGT